MKKIIAILAMVALVGGVAFAETSIGANVHSTVQLVSVSGAEDADGNAIIEGSGVVGNAVINIDGANDDGTFGGWARFVMKSNFARSWQPWEAQDGAVGADVFGYAWWKPIDQFTMRMGGNPDGFYDKHGFSGWMFYQTVSDVGIVNVGNAWGGGYSNIHAREAFYGGFADNGLMFEINPIDVLGINLVLPYYTTNPGGGAIELENVFGALLLQVNANLDFGNIALTYKGNPAKTDDDKALTMGDIYLSASIGAIENVNIDFSVHMTIPGEDKGHPIGIGAAAKIGINDTIGLKIRAVATLGGNKDEGKDDSTSFFVDLLPYFTLSDAMTLFVSAGLAMKMPSEGDSAMSFHINPYLQVGSEWGPKFVAGLRIWQDLGTPDEEKKIQIQVPIALHVGF